MNLPAYGRSIDSIDTNGRTFTLFWALQDETARTILVHTTEQARPAKELASFSDVSLDTVYRRVQTLKAHDLLQENHRLDEQGNRYNVYRATISRIEVELADETIRTEVESQENAADRFTRLWEAIQQ